MSAVGSGTVVRMNTRWAIILTLSIAAAACTDDDEATIGGDLEGPPMDAATGPNDAGAAAGDDGAVAVGDADIAAGDATFPDAEPIDPADAGLADADPDLDSGVNEDAAVVAPLRVLVFSRTLGFRHGSIQDGQEALQAAAEDRGWAIETTEDAERFTDATLATFDVVVFLSTTGNVLDDDQQGALERYMTAGGGWVGIHAAADCEYDWDYYGQLVAAWFRRHPRIQDATLHVEDGSHPATAHLDSVWARRDEWYDFRTNPRPDVQVLITIDESSYEGGEMGDDHPIAWVHENLGGRAFYTAGGHTSQSFQESDFVTHIVAGIEWAGRRR